MGGETETAGARVGCGMKSSVVENSFGDELCHPSVAVGGLAHARGGSNRLGARRIDWRADTREGRLNASCFKVSRARATCTRTIGGSSSWPSAWLGRHCQAMQLRFRSDADSGPVRAALPGEFKIAT